MKHIVVDARSITKSTGRYVERLLNYLENIDKDSSDRKYSVLVRKKGDWEPSAPNFRAIEANVADFSFAEQLELKKIIDDLKPDLVHFAMPQYPLLVDFSRYARINTIHDLTMINHKHKHWGFPVDQIKRLVFRVVMRRAAKADAVLVPSRFVKKQLLERYVIDPSNIHVTYESADPLHVASKRYEPMKRKDFIFYVGGVTPYKNIKRLIEAFELLKIDHPDLHLLIVGKENRFHEELHKIVEKRAVPDVHFTGFIPDAQLAWLYENAKAYVFPSLSEGFGLPGLESMQYNCPLVSSNATCLPEVYGDAAHYFDPEDVEDMRHSIHEVLTDSSLRKKLVINGKKRAKKYSWERMAEETKSAYINLLDD